MLYNAKAMVSRIKSHIKKRGGVYNAWFVGLGKDARSCLFKTHGVQKKGDHWVLIHAESPTVAWEVKSHLIKTVGLTGDGAALDQVSDFVYAYKKNAHTRP